MIPGINPKQMKEVMKKMGIKQEEIHAEEVVIKCPDKNLVILNPQIIKMNMMGQDSLQITGEIQEVPAKHFTDEDVETVMEEADCSKKAAEEALEETHGDIAEAILKLKR